MRCVLCVVRFFVSCNEKRSRVYVQNAPVSHGTRERFERTHGRVLKFASSLTISASLLVSISSLMCLSPLTRLSFSLSLSISLSSSSLSVTLSKTMTMIARPVSTLCTHGLDLTSVPECDGRGPLLVGRTCSHHARNISGYSCASLVPLGIKWAHICAEKENVLGVYVMKRVVVIVTSMAVPQNKTISVIAHKLHLKNFSITALCNSKIDPHQVANIMVFFIRKTKDVYL